MSQPARAAGRGAADLLRAVGLLADGPVTWGRPVSGRGPGIYLVELPHPPAVAPIDLGRIGEWLARTPGLRLDGVRPTGKELAARLMAFWLPGEPVVFAAATDRSIGGRVAALIRHVPGDRQPHPDGQWLHLLSGLSVARLWWASTDAPDEALDAVLTAFEDGLDPKVRGALADGAMALPFATTRRPTGERKAHGISGGTAPGEPAVTTGPGRRTDLPPGEAEGAADTAAKAALTSHVVAPPPGHPPRRRHDDGPVPRRIELPAPALKRTVARRSTTTRAVARPRGARQAPGTAPTPGTALTPDGVARLEAELDELTRVRRPAVVARIRSAKELGDLRENAEYHAAREEQSFLEGRVQAIEALLRHHVVIAAPAAGSNAVHIGSTVTIADEGGAVTWTIVGPTEANPAEGRISIVSPVGAALIGRSVGDEVTVRTPRGEAHYRVLAIDGATPPSRPA
jgi:transcription elongation factor GreA